MTTATIQDCLKLARRRNYRRKVASYLRDTRRNLTDAGLGASEANKYARGLAYSHYGRPTQTTRRALLAEARADLRFARSRLPGIDGSGSYDHPEDGYSMCGLADMHDYQREEAYKNARQCARMAAVA